MLADYGVATGACRSARTGYSPCQTRGHGTTRCRAAGGGHSVGPWPMRSGPVLIAFDGSPTALRALREAAELLAPRAGLVVVVWEAGAAYDFATIPSASLELPPAQLDLRRAAELDQALYADAERLARYGAAAARSLGMPADALAVADELTVSETLVRIADDVDAAAIVVGRHDHSALHDVLVGSTAKGLLRQAPCPVLVVRSADAA